MLLLPLADVRQRILLIGILMSLIIALAESGETRRSTTQGVIAHFDETHPIEAGTTLALNCTLTAVDSDFRNASDHLKFVIVMKNETEVVVPESFYGRPDGRTLLMTMPNVSVELSGSWFDCRLGENLIEAVLVSIAEPPKAVSWTVVADETKGITAAWCSNRLSERYSMKWKLAGMREVYSCDNLSGDNATNDRKCWKCTIDYTSNPIQLRINGSNEFGSHVTKFLIYPPNYIRWTVEQLTVSDTGPNDVNVRWKIPKSYDDFNCSVACLSERGTNFTSFVTVTQFVSQCRSLTPDTPYKISVSCKPVNGVYWSDEKAINFTTAEDAPSGVPTIHPGWFRYESHSSEGDTGRCPVQVFWKSVPRHLRHGKIVAHEISDGNTTTRINVSDVTSATVEVPCSEDCWLTLRAFTAAGSSPPSYVFIPAANNKTAQLEAYVEATADQSKVTVHWSLTSDVEFDNFTVFYCKGLRSCEEEPLGIAAHCESRNKTIDLPGSGSRGLWLYSVSGNSERHTTGLLRPWISCVYGHNVRPAAPAQPSIAEVSDTEASVSWMKLRCDELKARVLSYVLQLYRNDSPDDVRNITVASDVTEYRLKNLAAGANYTLALYAISSTGRGPPSYRTFTTSRHIQLNQSEIPPQASSSSVWMPAAAVLAVMVMIGLIVAAVVIVVIWLSVRRCRRKYRVPIAVPKRHDIISDGSEADSYKTLTYEQGPLLNIFQWDNKKQLTSESASSSASSSSGTESSNADDTASLLHATATAVNPRVGDGYTRPIAPPMSDHPATTDGSALSSTCRPPGEPDTEDDEYYRQVCPADSGSNLSETSSDIDDYNHVRPTVDSCSNTEGSASTSAAQWSCPSMPTSTTMNYCAGTYGRPNMDWENWGSAAAPECSSAVNSGGSSINSSSQLTSSSAAADAVDYCLTGPAAVPLDSSWGPVGGIRLDELILDDAATSGTRGHDNDTSDSKASGSTAFTGSVPSYTPVDPVSSSGGNSSICSDVIHDGDRSMAPGNYTPGLFKDPGLVEFVGPANRSLSGNMDG